MSQYKIIKKTLSNGKTWFEIKTRWLWIFWLTERASDEFGDYILTFSSFEEALNFAINTYEKPIKETFYAKIY